MIRSKLLWLILLLVATLGISIRTEEARLRRQRARTVEVAMQLANVDAARDSTRDVALENGRVAQLLGDSLRLVEKRVVQTAQKADALDAAMRRERVASYALNATIDSLRRSATSAASVAVGGDTRVASFTVRQEPFTVNAAVEMPPPPDSATLSLRIRLDPVSLQLRVTCAPPDSLGLRIASAGAVSAAWAQVRLAQLEQSPEVCNAVPMAGPGRRRITFSPIILAAGVFAQSRARPGWGLLLGTGFAVRL